MSTAMLVANICFMLGSVALFSGTLIATLHQLGVLK